MRLSAICAMSENRVIGYQNTLPWKLPADLRHFKKITLGFPIILGRKTYESIGKALPGRLNVIVTRDPHFCAPGCVVANSIDTALDAVAFSSESFVIGGAILYQQFLTKLTRLYITEIHHTFPGDAFFPDMDMTEWQEVMREEHKNDPESGLSYSFIIYDRNSVPRP